MKKTTFKVPRHVSVSLISLTERKAGNFGPVAAARAAGFSGEDAERIHSSDKVSLLLECSESDALSEYDLAQTEELVPLAEGFASARVGPETAEKLITCSKISRVQTKKQSGPHLKEVLPEIRLVGSSNNRSVPEDGSGVLIGVVDSGFDLTHPVFRDVNGNLRVEALLDQEDGNRQFDTAQLETAWMNGRGPGVDLDGHGTHVACIAGGSAFTGFDGIAPGARFLLVRTDFLNTDTAVRWIFDQANRLSLPCVVNMSLGHHFGSHDGTDAEERFHRAVSGPGRILVISAGNEREDSLHIGGRFFAGQAQEVAFDMLRPQKGNPNVTLTLWYSEQDKFDITLVLPSGQSVSVPAANLDVYRTSGVDLELARQPYVWSRSIKAQISISFKGFFKSRDLLNWKLHLTCKKAAVGRVDGWFHNSGYALFSRGNPLVERSRTVGLAATGDACLAVASHVGRNTWDSDLGSNEDLQVVKGRTSPFSSLGPTRDGRWKPDLSAPGQYVTAALADDCELSRMDQRALVDSRLVTIEGTSMAAPIVTGTVALMLQKKKSLSVADVRGILAETARHDAHTGSAAWEPAYGFGKIDVAAALSKV